MRTSTRMVRVPPSPWMRTVAELSATCWTSVIICLKAGLTPMALPWRSRSPRRRWSARFCWISERRSSACRTTRKSWARWSGLVRKSYAPSFIAFTASSTVPKAVRRMTSTSGAIAFAARRTSMPVRPGILRSVTTRSIPPPWSRSSAPRPSEARMTRNPSRVSVRSRLSRRPGSSSAISSVAGSDMDGPLDRRPDREDRARARAVRPLDLAAVLLHDLARDREAEAGALRLRGEELLEEARRHLVRNAAASVGHGDLHRIAVEAARDPELAAARQRLQPVLYEVQHRLAQEAAVDLHHRHARVDLDAHPEPLARGDRPDEVGQLLHELAHRLLLEVGAREAGEGQVLLGERVHRADRLADGREQARRLLHVPRRPPLHDVAQHLGIEPDGSDRVAHLVGDLERQAPDGGHALGHHQLLLRGLELRQRPLELLVEPLHLRP